MTSRGFTLVELLIYLALTSLVLTSLVYWTLGVINLRVENGALAVTVAGPRLILEVFGREVRAAKTVIEPLPGSSANQLRLTTSAAESIKFVLQDQELFLVDSLGTTTISGPALKLNNFAVTNLATPSVRDDLIIEFQLESGEWWHARVNRRL